jgi:hypothetical protein
MSHHPITPLASSQINHDHLKVELVEPDTMPAMVRIVWPPQPTVVDPKRSLMLQARWRNSLREHIVLAAIRAERRL